jgi:hypothetical protein
MADELLTRREWRELQLRTETGGGIGSCAAAVDDEVWDHPKVDWDGERWTAAEWVAIVAEESRPKWYGLTSR